MDIEIDTIKQKYADEVRRKWEEEQPLMSCQIIQQLDTKKIEDQKRYVE